MWGVISVRPRILFPLCLSHRFIIGEPITLGLLTSVRLSRCKTTEVVVKIWYLFFHRKK